MNAPRPLISLPITSGAPSHWHQAGQVYLQRRNVRLEKQVLKPRGHGDAEECQSFPHSMTALPLWLQEFLCIAARKRVQGDPETVSTWEFLQLPPP